MRKQVRSFVLALAGLSLLALTSCGANSTGPFSASPVDFGLWAMPDRVWISQGSSEMVAVGGCTPTPCVSVAGNIQSTAEPVSVQITGLPEGVTASPMSFALTTDEAPQAVEFFVGGSATPGNITVTLTGSSGTLSHSLSVPMTVALASPAGPQPCSNSNPPPSPVPGPAFNEWTWESGSNSVNQVGVYGTEGLPSPTNVPGARVSPSAWTDSSGNLWLFGGYGTGPTAAQNDLNDVWKYDPKVGMWTWMTGSNTPEQPGTYGVLGTPAVGNVPGARYEATSWTDTSGDFWLFGGLGLDSAGTRGDLNDLWRYSPATNMWTWMGGPSTLCNLQGNSACAGVYGTQGVPAPGNWPGSRTDAVGWADSCGNLWLFGGFGWDSTGRGAPLNDLWQYDTATNMWRWVSGANITNQNGTYGTLAVPNPGNMPGARTGAAAWTDASGNFWLFGGEGNDVNGIRCEQGQGALECTLDDLWEYNPNTDVWTWMGGSDVIAQNGVYGAQGTPAAGNFPGARWLAVSWTDSAGKFWLFGGDGFDSFGTGGGNADLNDIWKYDPATGIWTWISGSNVADQTSTYGTQGTSAPGNIPGAREVAVGWIDGSGNLWLFGGFAPWTTVSGKFNDLWKYQP